MSVVDVENPVATVLRLIENRIRVVKENGAVAAIKCTEENYDREVLRDYDAQITVGLDPRTPIVDQRLNLSGSLRRQIAILRVFGFPTEKPTSSADPAKMMRDKISRQVKAIIRENRQLPYETVYNFVGEGWPAGVPHKAYDAAGALELEPSSGSWEELSAPNYQKIWYNDDDLHSRSVSVVGQYPQMLFRFKIGKSANTDTQPLKTCISQIVLSFVGYGTAAAGDGATVQVYNNTTEAWTNAQAGVGSSKEVLTITLSSSLTDYVDSDGYLWILARTTNPSDGSAAVLYCDFVQCTIRVRGLTFCDVVSYRDVDLVSVKPFIFKTELILRGWFFENVT